VNREESKQNTRICAQYILLARELQLSLSTIPHLGLDSVIHSPITATAPNTVIYVYLPSIKDEDIKMLFKKLAPCTASSLLKANYATVASSKAPGADHWPHHVHSTKPPTPYQILNTTPSEPYSKARFTELVKIYHPDRCDHPAGHACAHLPPTTRLERFE
jgi:hypothetical protein